MASKKGGATAVQEKEQAKIDIQIRIDKLFDDTEQKLKAIASVNIGEFAVHGIRIYESEKGLFVSMPSKSYTDSNGEKQYEDIFHPMTQGARASLIASVAEAYEHAKQEQTQSQATSEQEAPVTAPNVQKM